MGHTFNLPAIYKYMVGIKGKNMERHFTIRFDKATLDIVRDFTKQAEHATGTVIHWEIVGYWSGTVWLRGVVQ